MSKMNYLKKSNNVNCTYDCIMTLIKSEPIVNDYFKCIII